MNVHVKRDENKQDTWEWHMHTGGSSDKKFYRDRGGCKCEHERVVYEATNAFDASVPVFTAVGGNFRSNDPHSLLRVGNLATDHPQVETFADSDPVTSILVGWALAVKMSPHDFIMAAVKRCDNNIWVYSNPGETGFVGMSDEEFARQFGQYAATVPEVHAQAVAAFVPPPRRTDVSAIPGLEAAPSLSPLKK